MEPRSTADRTASRRTPWLALGLVACLAVAAGAYLWATGLMDSLSAYRSPLHASPPQPGPALGDALTRRVVFVLVDGLRLDTAHDSQAMPFLAYAAAFHLLYAVLGGQTYSLSSFGSVGGAIVGTAWRALLSLAAAWGVMALGLRPLRGGRRRAAGLALALSAVVALLLALPVLVHSVVNGLTVTWALPEPLPFFLALQSLIQLLFVALAGPLLAGLSALLARHG